MDQQKVKENKPRAEKYNQKLSINTDFDTAVKVMFKNADKSKQADKSK